MTMRQLTRMMEASEFMTPTQAVTFLSRELVNFEDKETVFSILSLELETNNIGLAKAKKWMANIFDVFEEEITSEYDYYGDLGEAMYHLNNKDTTNNYTIKGFKRLLELDCSNMTSSSFTTISGCVQEMNNVELKWFVRYWLRTTRNGIKEATLQKVLARFYNKKLKDVKTHCNFNKISDVVSFYERNIEPPVNLTYGKFIKPMLAKEIPTKDWPTNFVVDYKYDGNRYQIHIEQDKVMVFNRKGKIVTQQFPDVVELVQQYEVNTAILDGEIYPINEDDSPAEHKLMGTRVHSKNVQEAMERVKVKWVIFDCLMIDSETTMNMTYTERLDKMKDLPNQAHRITEGDIMAFYNDAINEGFEGIIVKDASLPYESNKRSKGWAKYKPPRIDLDVVIISAKYGDGRNSDKFATFEIAVKSDNGFMSIGNIGSGFTDMQLVSLTNTLRKNVESFKGGKYSFLPRVVLEITADLVTRDSKGNLSLRFPRMKRIREDKFVTDINTDKDMERLE